MILRASGEWTYQFMQDGARNTIVSIYGLSTTTANAANEKLIDMSSLNTPSTRIKVMKITWNCSVGVDVELKFEDVASANHESFAVLSAGSDGIFDWTTMGGRSNVNVPNPTGSILIDTVGFTAVDNTDAIAINLWFKKVRKFKVGGSSHDFGYNVGDEAKDAHTRVVRATVAGHTTHGGGTTDNP